MLDTTQSIAQIVLDHPETAAVFQRHDLDFCCHGKQSFRDACARAGKDASAVAHELDAVIAGQHPTRSEDPRLLATPELTRYLVTHHHDYLRVALPTAISLATKVARVHGHRQPELQELVEAIRELEELLVPHLEEEETAIFPALQAEDVDPAVIAHMLETMEEEHRLVGGQLAVIRAASDDYALPQWACRTYRALLAELANIEADIKRHVHLENHVLAPRFTTQVARAS